MADDNPTPEELGYSPEDERLRLRQGYRNELEMANRLVMARPQEIVLAFGKPAGIQGPDIVSIGEDGLLNRWDVKWRTIDRVAGPSIAAEAPLEQAAVEEAVWNGVVSQQVSLAVGLKALRLYEAGTYNIFTVDPAGADKVFLVQVQDGHFRRS